MVVSQEFNRELEKIHEKISIRDEDRRPYTEMYDAIRDWLVNEMRAADPVFNKVFKGYNLCGSYPNRVRIITPSEFDVHILLELPFPFSVCPHRDRPGFIEIIGKQWKNLNDSRMKKTFREWYREINVLHKTCLNRNKLQGWIADIIESVLSKNRYEFNGYKISHKLCDVAQKIRVKDMKSNKRISIDFVPAIVLKKENVRSLVKGGFKAEYYDSFVAIPKRLIGCGPRSSRRYTFQLVNPTAERDIIWDKQNLKVVYRLLKSMRNKHNLQRFKSYFLTAIFLLELEKQPADFWQKPVGDIFVHMLYALTQCFADEFLPFYWAKRFSLLSILTDDELGKNYRILVNVNNRLSKLSLNEDVPYTVVSHFKLRREKEDEEEDR